MTRLDTGSAVVVLVGALVAISITGCSSGVSGSLSRTPESRPAVSAHSAGAVGERANGPRMTKGVVPVTRDAAQKSAKFAIKYPAGDAAVQRILPYPSDGGYGVCIQYEEYEVVETPTDIPLDLAEYRKLTVRRDLADPSSAFLQYRAAKVGTYEALLSPAGAQYDHGALVNEAPLSVMWDVPAATGSGAQWLRYQVTAWDMSQSDALRIAESLASL